MLPISTSDADRPGDRGTAIPPPDELDFTAFHRNKLPIAIDLLLGVLFFIVAKLTTLQNAALVAAGAGLLLYVLQRMTGKDLLGGMAMFGIVLSIIAAGLAILFQDDDAVKWRSSVVGLIGAGFFLLDGLTGGKRIGTGLSHYLPYSHIDVRRLALGMGLVGFTMAALNLVAVRLLSTDGWLFYTTFVDFGIVMLLMMGVMKWARPRAPADAQTL